MPRCDRGVTMASMETLVRSAVPGRAAVLLDELVELRAEVVAEGRDLLEGWRPALRRRAFLPSALNLAHYIALRRRDLRGLQEALMPLGLSSLGAARRVCSQTSTP